MVTNSKHLVQRKLIVIVGIAAVIISLLLVFAWNFEIRRMDSIKRQVESIALDKVRQECQAEGLGRDVCHSIMLTTDHYEDFHVSEWIVNAHAKDLRSYSATVRIVWRQGAYVVDDYQRGTRPE